VQFIQSFFLVVSSLILIYIVYYSFIHRTTPGAIAFSTLTIAMLIWTLGSFFELYAVAFQDKLIWRNIQQIGVFGVPISAVYFALAYTHQTKGKKYFIAALIPSILSVLLIFTNELHHLMRSGCSLEASPVFGESLIIHSTALGSVLVAYNFSLALIATAILINYVRKIGPALRKQVYTIIFCMLYVFCVSFVQKALLEQLNIFIQISVLTTPAAVIMVISLFRHRTFSLSPIARDKVFEVVNQGIMVLDENGVIIDVNSYAMRTLKDYFYIQKSPLGMQLEKINPHFPELNQLLGHTKDEQMEIHVKDAYISLTYYPLSPNNEKYIGSVIIINNITVRKLYERSLKNKAEKDYLTQLLNKFGFHKALQKYITAGNLIHYAVLMMDVDNFKQINDTYGHTTGDAVLRDFTEIINSIVRTEDIAGRFGGDEFVVVIPDVSKDIALQIAERIRKAVDAHQFILSGQVLHYTISAGIAARDSADYSFNDIMEKADQALYQAKSKSRNCSVVYSEQDVEA